MIYILWGNSDIMQCCRNGIANKGTTPLTQHNARQWNPTFPLVVLGWCRDDFRLILLDRKSPPTYGYNKLSTGGVNSSQERRKNVLTGYNNPVRADCACMGGWMYVCRQKEVLDLGIGCTFWTLSRLRRGYDDTRRAGRWSNIHAADRPTGMGW